MSVWDILLLIIVIGLAISWMGLGLLHATRRWRIPTVAEIDES